MADDSVEAAKISRKAAITVALITMLGGIITTLIATENLPFFDKHEIDYAATIVLTSSLRPDTEFSNSICVRQASDVLTANGYSILKNGVVSVIGHQPGKREQVGIRCYKGTAFFFGTGENAEAVATSLRLLRLSMPQR